MFQAHLLKPSLVIVGLGNPGKSYEKTRHNIGFRAIDELSKEFGVEKWDERQKFSAFTQEARLITFPILLVKPTTYMNDSGVSVKKLIDFFKLDAKSQMLVICDDIDLPLGEVRLRMKGGPGTHNGLRSIVEQCGEDFARIRIGLGQGPKGEDLAAWVLSVPPKEETEALSTALQSLPELLRGFVLNASSEKESTS